MQLVARDEDAIALAVLEFQVVAGHPADGLRLEAEEASDAVVLVDDRVAGAQLGEAGQRAAARAVTFGSATAAQQPVLGQDRDLGRRPDEALAQAGGREQHARLRGRAPAVEELGVHAREVVERALGLAAPRPRHDRAVARAHELLELGLGLSQRTRRSVSRLRAQLDLLAACVRRQPDARALLERRLDAVRPDVEMVRVHFAAPAYRAAWRVLRDRFGADFREYMDAFLREIRVEKSFDPMSQWKTLVVEELAAAPSP